MRPKHRVAGETGFTLIDVLMVVALIGVIAAIAVPGLQNMVNNLRLGISVREFERELQYAKLKAVSSNTVIRVLPDCPGARPDLSVGYFRAVELLGTISNESAGDDNTNAAVAAVRCRDDGKYPYAPGPGGPDHNDLTKPNNDGPIRTLQPGVKFSVGFKPVIEFWPDGSVHQASVANPWGVLGAAGATFQLQRTVGTKTYKKQITVNPLGKIQMDR